MKLVVSKKFDLTVFGWLSLEGVSFAVKEDVPFTDLLEMVKSGLEPIESVICSGVGGNLSRAGTIEGNEEFSVLWCRRFAAVVYAGRYSLVGECVARLLVVDSYSYSSLCLESPPVYFPDFLSSVRASLSGVAVKLERVSFRWHDGSWIEEGGRLRVVAESRCWQVVVRGGYYADVFTESERKRGDGAVIVLPKPCGGVDENDRVAELIRCFFA